MGSGEFAGPEEAVGFEAATSTLSPAQADLVERLLKRLISLKHMRWTTLRSFAKRGLDLIDVEATVEALHQAGWIEIRRKRDGKGTLTATQLRLAESAVDEASRYLGERTPSEKEQLLATLIEGLQGLKEAAVAPTPERVFVRRLLGQTKSVRLRDHRGALERAVGCRLEELVRFHVDVVLTAGPVRYRFGGVDVDLRGSSPWSAVTEPVSAGLTEVVVEGAVELVTVENQTVFESLLYEGRSDTSVLVFTAGYLGTVQRNWIAALVGAGIRRVRHWGDLDPWGLDIYRDLRDWLGSVDADVVVEPWRMGPEPLERPDAQKLSSEDWVKLHRYLAKEDAPLRETAEAMRRLGRKLEQEALLHIDLAGETTDGTARPAGGVGPGFASRPSAHGDFETW